MASILQRETNTTNFYQSYSKKNINKSEGVYKLLATKESDYSMLEVVPNMQHLPISTQPIQPHPKILFLQSDDTCHKK